MFDGGFGGIGDIIGGIGDWIGGLFGSGGGQAVGTAASGIGDAAAQYGSQLGGTALDFASGLGQGIINNPIGALGLGMTGFNTFAPMFMGGGGGGNQQQQLMGMPANFQYQAQGSDPSQMAGMKRQMMGDLQSRGLESASPEFLANQMGLTPDELEKLMGRGMR